MEIMATTIRENDDDDDDDEKTMIERQLWSLLKPILVSFNTNRIVKDVNNKEIILVMKN